MHLLQVVSFVIKIVLCFSGAAHGLALCEEPPPVPNAYVEWSGVGRNAISHYTCYTHHVLVAGNLLRLCMNGVYSGMEPVCNLDCGVPRHIEGTTVGYSTTLANLTHSSKAVYECLPGLAIRAAGKVVTCDVYSLKWTFSKYFCYNDTQSIAEGCTAILEDGTDVSHIVDGDNTCIPLTGTTFDIYLNDTYKLIKMEFKHNLAKVYQIKVWAVQNSTGKEMLCVQKGYAGGSFEELKILFSSKTFGNTKCFGDCGQPPINYGQSVSFTNTTEGSTAVVSCVPPSYPLEGHGLITCLKTMWTNTQLTCTVIPDIALHGSTSNPEFDLALDDNYTSCVDINDTINYPRWSIDLGQDYEIYVLSVTFGEMVVNQQIKAYLITSSGLMKTCQYRRFKAAGVVVLIQCQYHRVGQIVTLQSKEAMTICDVKIRGRPYNEPLECYNLPRGKDYKGMQNVTNHGYACVPWTSIPGYDSNIGSLPDITYDEAANNCRNPGNVRLSPWCFISQTEWQYCPVPKCENICRRTSSGVDYIGKIGISASNKSCKKWSLKQFNERFRFNLPYDNHCGNQVLDQAEPWCIVENDNGDIVYEHCSIPACPTLSKFTTITLSPGAVDSQFLSVVLQCFYFNENSDVFVHSAFQNAFFTSCAMTNETKIIYMCSFIEGEWKFVEYFCRPVSSSVSTYIETSSTMALDSVASEITTVFIDTTPTTDGSINLDSTSEGLIVFTSSEVDLSSDYQSITDVFILTGSEVDLSTGYLYSTDVFMLTGSENGLFTDYQSRTDVFMLTGSENGLSTGYHSSSDVFMLTGSEVDLSTDYHSNSESCDSPMMNMFSSWISYSGCSSFITETVTSTLQTQLDSRSCECYCRSKPTLNLTALVTNQPPIAQNLILNKSNLSRTFRKKNSIHDSRTLAIAIGSVGVFVIIGMALFIASNDFFRVFIGTSDLMRRAKTLTNTNSI